MKKYKALKIDAFYLGTFVSPQADMSGLVLAYRTSKANIPLYLLAI